MFCYIKDCDSLSKKSEASFKSDDSIENLEEEVHLRSKSVNFAERSSVNQCINELSSNLAAEAARRRCNSEIVQRTDITSNGKTLLSIIFVLDNHLKLLWGFKIYSKLLVFICY